MAGAATLTDWDWFTGMQTKFPVEIWHRNIKTDQGITCFFVPLGAHVAYVFVAHTSTQSSNKQRGAKSPLSSTWNEKSEPRARHEKKTHPQQSSTQKPGSCRQGQAAAGSWAAADRQTDRQTERQTDRQAACPPRQSLMQSPVFGEEHGTQKQKLESHETRPVWERIKTHTTRSKGRRTVSAAPRHLIMSCWDHPFQSV